MLYLLLYIIENNCDQLHSQESTPYSVNQSLSDSSLSYSLLSFILRPLNCGVRPGPGGGDYGVYAVLGVNKCSV